MHRHANSSNRQLLPKPTPTSSAIHPPENSTRHKRHQVKLACERCRKRKVKCDGHKPSCRPCLTANTGCSYPTGDATLKQRFAELSDAYTDIKTAYNSIRDGAEHPADGLPPPLQVSPNQSLSDKTSRTNSFPFSQASPHQELQIDNPLTAIDDKVVQTVMGWQSSSRLQAKMPISRWTRVSNDETLLNHLFVLFWTWDSTLARILHRKLFLRDLCAIKPGYTDRAGESGQFCCSVLVNSILSIAMGCFLKTNPSQQLNIQSRDFANEAFRLISLHGSYIPISLIQGVAILSAYEYTFGNSEKGVNIYLDTFQTLRYTSGVFDNHVVSQPESGGENINHALAFVLGGFHGLDKKMALIMNGSTTASPLRQKVMRPGDNDTINSLWIPYPVSNSSRLSYYGDLLVAEYDLMTLTDEIFPLIQDNRTSAVPDYAVTRIMYDRVIQWKRIKSQQFQGQSSTTPSWVALQIFYHLLCIKLLRPFVGLSFLNFDGGSPAQILSVTHSESIISIQYLYSTTFGMLHEFWLLDACYTAISLLISNSQVTGFHDQHLTQGCELLYNMSKYMPRASQLGLALWNEAQADRVDLPPLCKRMLSAAKVAIEFNTIRNVVPLIVNDEADGLVTLAPQQVTFSSTIQRIHKET